MPEVRQGRSRTQWAETAEDQALPRGAVVSERFELARNFCNKLWNASRFALMNLDGYDAGPVAAGPVGARRPLDSQPLGDRDAAGHRRAGRVPVTPKRRGRCTTSAWDEFCSFYVEMVKERFQDPERRVLAQRVAAHALDVLLRLLHPMIPFITEEIWQLLNQIAPLRGLGAPARPSADLIVAPWPEVHKERRDATIEDQFQAFHAALSALREIRSRQNIGPREPVRFSIECEPAVVQLLEPLQDHFTALARAEPVEMGSDVQPPVTHAAVQLPQMKVLVDLAGLIDVDAEIERLVKQRERLQGSIAGKERKLSNESFVQRAPAEVVQRERDSLQLMQEQLKGVVEALAALRGPGS